MNFNLTPQQARRAWVNALRSGEYEQGQCALCTLDPDDKPKYCCLCVACDLFRHVEDSCLLPVSTEYGNRYFGNERQVNVLPNVVREWLCLATMGAHFGSNEDCHDSLWWLNDREDRDFNFIADVIESEPVGLLAQPCH